MIKTDVKAYTIDVERKTDMVSLICITYCFDTHSRYYTGEFYELFSHWSNRPKVNVPSGQQYSFKDEIHSFRYGAAIAPEYKKDIEQWIEQKAHEAYGEDCRVVVKPLDPKFYLNDAG